GRDAASHTTSCRRSSLPGRETPPSTAPSPASCLRSTGYSCVLSAAPPTRSSPRDTPPTASPPATTPPACARRSHRSCCPTSTAHSSADCTPPTFLPAAPVRRRAMPNASLPQRSRAASPASHEWKSRTAPARVASTDCIVSRPLSSSTATEIVSRWTSIPIYLTLFIRVLLSLRFWLSASHSTTAAYI